MLPRITMLAYYLSSVYHIVRKIFTFILCYENNFVVLDDLFLHKVLKELRSKMSSLIKIISTIRICFSEIPIGLINIALYILLKSHDNDDTLTLFHCFD